MPAFFIRLKDGEGTTRQADGQLIVAEDSDDALETAKARFDGDAGPAAWDDATLVELVDSFMSTPGSLPAWKLRVRFDAELGPDIDVSGSSETLCVLTPTINDGGSGYNPSTVGDIVTVVGGTFTRAARVKIVSQSGGAVTEVALVDPGEYTVAPPASGATVTHGPPGSGLTLDLISDTDTFFGAVSATFGLLLAELLNPDLDLSIVPATLTCAGSADNLGDKVLTMALVPPSGVPITSGLTSTIIDEGAVGDPLQVEFPSITAYVVPELVVNFRT